LHWLLGQLGQQSQLEIHHIVLPFVDASSIQPIENKEKLIRALQETAEIAKQQNIEIHLETDLPPKDFLALLEDINHPFVKVNFDIGNSASLGYSPKEELTLLGPWLGSVHIKDRIEGGGTVPLGTGNADFVTCFELFNKIEHENFFILQAAREEPGKEIELAIQNHQFVKNYLPN